MSDGVCPQARDLFHDLIATEIIVRGAVDEGRRGPIGWNVVNHPIPSRAFQPCIYLCCIIGSYWQLLAYQEPAQTFQWTIQGMSSSNTQHLKRDCVVQALSISRPTGTFNTTVVLTLQTRLSRALSSHAL